MEFEFCKNFNLTTDAPEFLSEILFYRFFESKLIPKFLKAKVEENEGIIIMEKLEPLTIRKIKTLSESKALDICKQCAHCVLELHSKGIIHRDVKLDNFLIKRGKVRICDFGLAYFTVPGSSPRSKLKVQTKEYRAPEVSRDGYRITKQLDYFSLGVVFGEILSKGEYSTKEEVRQAAKAKKFPKSINFFILKCTSKDYRKRPTFKDVANFFNIEEVLNSSDEDFILPTKRTLSEIFGNCKNKKYITDCITEKNLNIPFTYLLEGVNTILN